MMDKTEISANYFYHFTDCIDHIVSIMVEGFKPFYCMEKLSYIDLKDKNGKYLEMAFPVVCFCDLPSNLQKSHRELYGSYGIALNKDWGIKNHLTPIIYTNENAITSGVLKNLYNFWSNKKIQEDEILAYKSSVSYLLMCFKPYVGYWYQKSEKKYVDNYRFYDEREWRYLPVNCDGLRLHLEKSEYENKVKLKEENEKIQKHNHLNFSLNNLHSIYLTKESEVEVLLERISFKYQPWELSLIKKKIVYYNE